MKRIQIAFVSAAVLLASAARAESPDQVLITYDATVGSRHISGVSHELEWSATALGPDCVKVQLRIPVESFDSGHPEFDALLRSAAESERHPFIEIEGTARGKNFEGTVSVRGVTRPLRLSLGYVHLDDRLVINAAFPLELAAFGIAIPGAASRLTIDFVGRFPDEPRAVISGGTLSAAP